jgi:hypothetical protein
MVNIFNQLITDSLKNLWPDNKSHHYQEVYLYQHFKNEFQFFAFDLKNALKTNVNGKYI